MLARRTLAGALLALSVALIPAGDAFAKTDHHHGASATPLQLTLDKGSKWQTDAPLRKGMDAIRVALEGALPAVHRGGFAPQAYADLARILEKAVDGIVADCKLPEAADAQLHIILTHILDGTGMMKDASGQKSGIVKTIEAVNAYGEHFDHPGWRKLPH